MANEMTRREVIAALNDTRHELFQIDSASVGATQDPKEQSKILSLVREVLREVEATIRERKMTD